MRTGWEEELEEMRREFEDMREQGWNSEDDGSLREANGYL